MRKEYDFSKAKRGKFYHADQHLDLLLYLEEDLLAYFEKCAQGKGVELNTLIKEPQALVAELDELLEIVGDDENHRLIGLVDALSNLIISYEEAHRPESHMKGIDALRFLMEAHHLSQSDLPEIGSQGVVSEILHGKRKLNLRQIKLLAKKFHVEASTFIDDE